MASSRSSAVVARLVVTAGLLAGVIGSTGCAGSAPRSDASATQANADADRSDPSDAAGRSVTTDATSVGPTDDPEPIGDEALPDLGDRDVDVLHYDLDLYYQPAGGQLEGTAAIDLTIRNPTPNVAFDLKGLEVIAVSVDGQEVGFAHEHAKLRVDLAQPAGPGDRLRVTVRYGGKPVATPTRALDGVSVGWQVRDGGSYVLAEPEGARTWYPVNEHPQDKASYDITVTVPDGLVAVANGELVADEQSPAGHRTFHWQMADPMAPYLATVVIGTYAKSEAEGPDGLPLVAWVSATASHGDMPGRPRPPVPETEPADLLTRQHAALTLLTSKLGPFPFASYGAVVLPRDGVEPFFDGVAIETQALSLFGAGTIDPATLVHEAAHQWMGNSVSLTDWSRDIWWVEGFARFSEWLWSEETHGERAYEQQARATHAELADATRPYPAGALPLDQLFSSWSYDRGALVFYSLRAELGEDTFWSAVRRFIEGHRHANATTDDLIAAFEETSGRSLRGFFTAWLFNRDLPDLPA
ncbi:MAG: M1 family metallopeptidase [Acidimicrobiales bacterium]|nr:M1 family metallopeptidase [Acidimicrobiales bacterium]